MEERVPVADEPMSDYIHFKNVSDIRPCDQIRVGDEERVDFYEILSIRSDNTVNVYNHKKEEYNLLEEDEINNILSRDDSYKWSILVREIVPISKSNESLLIYFYAIESPSIGDDRVLICGWSIENQYPPETVTSFDKMSYFATFEEIQKSIQNKEDCFKPLFEKFNGEVGEILRFSAISAEYNADQLFGLQTEKTFGKEMEKQIQQKASTIDNTSIAHNNILD